MAPTIGRLALDNGLQVMAPTIGRLALDNGFHGSIPGDLVAPPPQNIHQ